MFYHLFIANIAKDFVHVNEYFALYSLIDIGKGNAYGIPGTYPYGSRKGGKVRRR